MERRVILFLITLLVVLQSTVRVLAVGDTDKPIDCKKDCPPSALLNKLNELDTKIRDDCAICYNELDSEGEDDWKISTTSCGHNYHAGCLKKWLDVAETCPLCRTKIDSDPYKTIIETLTNKWGGWYFSYMGWASREWCFRPESLEELVPIFKRRSVAYNNLLEASRSLWNTIDSSHSNILVPFLELATQQRQIYLSGRVTDLKSPEQIIKEFDEALGAFHSQTKQQERLMGSLLFTLATGRTPSDDEMLAFTRLERPAEADSESFIKFMEAINQITPYCNIIYDIQYRWNKWQMRLMHSLQADWYLRPEELDAVEQSSSRFMLLNMKYRKLRSLLKKIWESVDSSYINVIKPHIKHLKAAQENYRLGIKKTEVDEGLILRNIETARQRFEVQIIALKDQIISALFNFAAGRSQKLSEEDRLLVETLERPSEVNRETYKAFKDSIAEIGAMTLEEKEEKIENIRSQYWGSWSSRQRPTMFTSV